MRKEMEAIVEAMKIENYTSMISLRITLRAVLTFIRKNCAGRTGLILKRQFGFQYINL